MEVDRDLIEHVAEVSRIGLTEAEIKEFLPQLKEILDTFEKIQEEDTENIRPSYHPVELRNHLREDKPKPSLSNEEALKNSRNVKDGYFKGPRIL